MTALHGIISRHKGRVTGLPRGPGGWGKDPGLPRGPGGRGEDPGLQDYAGVTTSGTQDQDRVCWGTATIKVKDSHVFLITKDLIKDW